MIHLYSLSALRHKNRSYFNCRQDTTNTMTISKSMFNLYLQEVIHDIIGPWKFLSDFSFRRCLYFIVGSSSGAVRRKLHSRESKRCLPRVRSLNLRARIMSAPAAHFLEDQIQLKMNRPFKDRTLIKHLWDILQFDLVLPSKSQKISTGQHIRFLSM